MALDPVCGMTVDPAKAAGEFDHKGTKYYFCSKHCLHSFSSHPEQYLSKKAGAAHLRVHWTGVFRSLRRRGNHRHKGHAALRARARA